MRATSPRSYRDRVNSAYQAAWVLKLMAWGAAAVGVSSLIVTTAAYFSGTLSSQAAFGTILGTALGSILTGGTAYAAATNLGVAGARLEIVINTTDVLGSEEPVDLSL